MRIGWLAFTLVMTAGGAALAEPPQAPSAAATPAEAWDDSHMQARYRETPRTTRPRITGESGYGALASGSAEAGKEVAEAIDYTSQRQWIQGQLSTSRAKPGPKGKPDDGKVTRAPSIPRGSALRAGARSSGRRRH